MLHWSALGKERKALLKCLVDHMPLPGSYLAGGTALALLLGHRESDDFDWFCPDDFDPERLAQRLSNIKTFTLSESARGTLHGFFGGTRITWLHDPNPLLDHVVTAPDMPGLKLASTKDIAVMKIAALSHRGAAKNFVDLFILAQHQLSLDRIIALLPAKFPEAHINYYHIMKSLSYFDDVEAEPLPRMRVPLDWDTLKRYFQEEQVKLLEQINTLP